MTAASPHGTGRPPHGAGRTPHGAADGAAGPARATSGTTDLDGSVVVVTGAGSGIGRAVAVTAAAAGARVVLCGRRESALRETAAACPDATVVVADLTTPDAAQHVVSTALRRWGRVDGLVSNAGAMTGGAVMDLTDETWDISLELNLSAPFRLARAAQPALLDTRGALVFVSSVAGLRAPGQAAAYAASKAGVVMLSQTIAVDYGARGIRSNAVCPGWIASEMADAEMADFGGPLGLSRDAAYAEVTRLVPSRRPGTPDEAAAAVTWLLGPQSSFVNGAILSVDGGSAAVDVGTVAYDFSVAVRSS